MASCTAVGLAGASLTGMMPMGGGGGRGPGGDDDSVQRTVVEVATTTRGNIVVTGIFVGTVEPGQQVTVYPKVSAEVLSANFSVGDTVEAGDILFRLDSTDLEYSIAQAQANLASAQAKAQFNLETAQQDLDTYISNADEGLNSQLLSAEASVQSAEVALQKANNDYRQAKQDYADYVNNDYEYGENESYSDAQRDKLRNARVTAELNVETAQLSLESARASLDAVKKQIEDQKTSTENSVRSAELNANMAADQISLEKQQKDLGNYTVTAPISGVVEQRNIDPFDMASTQTAAYVISNKDAVSVTFNVAENALIYMEIGDAVTLEKNGGTCYGSISEISTMVDSTSGLYAVKVTVNNPPFELRSGSTIKLYAETQKVLDEMMVPIDAVYYDNGEPYVYVFENNTCVKRMIGTGISDSTNIQVVSGLSMTDDVIVTWSASLIDGLEVYLPGTAPEAGGMTGPAEGAPEAPEGDAGQAPERGPNDGNRPQGAEEGAAAEESGDNTPDHDDEEEAA